MIVMATFVFRDARPVEAADGGALTLHATVISSSAPQAPLTIELFRWSTDEERAPLVAALSAPPPAPPAPAAPAGGRAAAGRGGRGGRAAGPPPSPIDRLTTAIKAAPTVGFIWSEGPTGYSIKYAWRLALPEGGERIVLATDRRLGANTAGWSAVAKAPADKADAPHAAAAADFTVIEMRLGVKGTGEAKASISSPVVVDTAAKTLALDGYAGAPVLLKVTR
jgi:hypothetical protein